MADVIFNPDQGDMYSRLGPRGNGSSSGWITKLVMKLTGIEDEAKANQALLALAIVCFLISGFVLWRYL